jgi:hypothetical protein
VDEELTDLAWRPATQADLPGEWRARRILGPAAAVLMDVSYWLDASGRFSGAALLAGPPPTFEVLSGAWTLDADGSLQLGEESEPARAEVSGELLRLRGAEGSIVLERVELR